MNRQDAKMPRAPRKPDIGDVETAGAGGGVLDDVVERGLHHVDHAVDEGADGEVLARAGFHFAGVFFQQAFVEIAESFRVGRFPRVTGIRRRLTLSQTGRWVCMECGYPNEPSEK